MHLEKEKWALVTGGAKRVGKTIVSQLAKASWNLVVHYRSSHKEAEALRKEIVSLGRSCRLVQADLSKGAGIRKLCTALEKKLPPITLFVHNASLFYQRPLNEIAYDELHLLYNIHAVAPLLLVQSLQARRLEQAIFIVDWALQKPYPHFAPYLVSKGALHTLVKVLAVELSPSVRVNGICPGPVLPPAGYDPKKLARRTLLKKIGSAKDIAQAVLFLTQQPFITGSFLTIDGGRSLL